MASRFRIGLLVPLLLSIWQGLAAHDSENAFRLLPFTPSDPICSSSVPYILQDRQGFIWFGTPDGIDRYDGYETLHIRFPEGSSGYGAVRTMCEDDAGNIWIGSFKGISVWDAREQSIREYSKGAVARIVKSRDGALWVAANFGGFLRIDPVSGKCDTLSFSYHNANAHYGDDVCYDGDDTLWFLNGVGAIYRCHLRDRVLENIVSYSETPLKPPTNSITRMVYVDGYLCGGRQNHDTYLYDTRSGRFFTRPWGTARAGGMLADGGNYLVVSAGLFVFPKGLHHAILNSDETLPLYNEQLLYCALPDRDGSIWLGTNQNGVLRLLPNRAAFREIGDGLQVSALAPDDDGSVWIGTTDKGLYHYIPWKDCLVNVPLPGKLRQISGLGRLNGKLVIATASANSPLIMLDLETGDFSSHPEFPNDMYVFLEREDGDLFAGGWLLYKWSVEENKAVSIERVRSAITDMKSDRDGRRWIATSFSGVWMDDKDRWTHYTDSSGVVMRTQAIYPDKDGYIWICSPDDGLQRLDPKTRQTWSYTEFGGVPCQRITGIAADREGDLWLSTANGIATLNPTNGHTALYAAQDGLGINGTGFSRIQVIGDLLYAVHAGGLICFDPLLFKAVQKRGDRIVFTGFSLLGPFETHDSVPSPDILEEINGKSRIKLSARQNSFVLGVSQMDYDVPKSTRIDYRMEGYDQQWIPIEKGRIIFTNLPSGHYRLSVREVGRNGETLLSTRTVDIQIARPLWASIPAIILYLIVLFVSIFLIARSVQRQAFRKAEQQASMENERREADRQKQLYASKVEFLTSIAHEIRTPLTLVKAPVETLQSKLSHSADKSVLEDLDVMGRNADKLSDLLDELLDFRKLENSGIQINLSENEIDAIVRAVYNRFSLAARRKKMTMELSLPESPVSAAVDKSALDKILTNMLSNAIKYGKTQVRLSLGTDDESLKIVTENDGTCVPLSERERIFRPFERFVPEGSMDVGTGIGLFVCRNLAELHGGTLVMDDDTRINRFILQIPIVHIAKQEELFSLPEVLIPQQQPTVLIVEDSLDMLEFISRQFLPTYSILTAENGAAALKLLKEHPLSIPDCIISDVMMPEMDGFELLRRLKESEDTCHIPVLLLTARADADSRLLGLEYGADAYLSKPFSAYELMALTGSLIKNRELVRQKFASVPVSGYGAINQDSPDAHLLRTVDRYINEHLTDESLGVETLAREACMSSSSLFKKMKTLIGMGPSDYILLVRLKKSSALLQNTILPIAEVAAQTGFHSPSYFSACFKAQFGMTPKEFRSGSKLK